MLWPALAGLLLLLLAAAATFVVRAEWQAESSRARATAEGELDLLAALTAEWLVRGPEQALTGRLQAWGERQPDVVELRVTSSGGRTMGVYQRPAPAARPLSVDTRIASETEREARLTLVRDLAPLESRRVWFAAMLAALYALVAATVLALAFSLARTRRGLGQLRDSDERLLLAMRVSATGVFEHDHRTDSIYWSPELRNLFRWTATEPATVEKYIGRIHPDDRESMSAALTHAHDPAGDGVFDVAHRIVLPDGEIRWVSTRSLTLFAGEGPARHPVRTLGVIVDITERKHVDEALRQSEERLRQAVRVSQIGIYDHDQESDRIYWSAEQRRNYGFPADEPVTLDKFVACVYPEDRAGIFAAVQRAHDPTGDGLFDVEHRIIRRDGEVRWLITRSRTYFAGEGAARRPVRTIGAVLDVTDRRRVEEALRASEARLADAQRLGHMGSWDYDLVANSIAWSAEALRILELDSPGMTTTADAFFDIVHPDDRDYVRQHFARSGAAGTPQLEMTHRLLMADGRIKFVTERWEASDASNGTARRAAGTIQDVTERRNAEQAIRDLNEQLEARVAQRTADLSEALELNQRMLEASSLGIAAYRATGECVLANEAMGEIAGGTRDQVLGQNFRKLASWQRHGLLAAALRALETGVTQANEFQMVTSFGKRAWFQIYFGRFMRGGEPHLLMTIDDITTRKAAEAALKAANRELETFTYSVSHDLKGPLRGIDGYSRLLQRDYSDKLGEDGRQFLDNVRRAAIHMDRLIDDLLAYSRLERQEMQSGSVDLSALIGSVLAERAADVLSHQARVRVDVPAGTVLRCDRNGLAMSLRNLVENALKFGRPGVPPEIDIEVRDLGSSWQIAVRDAGIGFDMKFHDRIFRIFQRLHRPEEYPGTGVGLAIVRKAMERIGGRVWAESAPSHGATFYLEIPK